MKFTKATRNDSFIKLALSGPSGSGKTYSALRLARGLVGPTGKIAVVDTENQSAKLYSDLTEFDHCDLASHRYTEFIEAVNAAVHGCYHVPKGMQLFGRASFFTNIMSLTGQDQRYLNIIPSQIHH